jgi:transcriptional regulator with XRE-family HTH domain
MSLNNLEQIINNEDRSIKEISILSGVSESEVSRIARGVSVPNQITMMKICNGLEKEMKEVFETNWKNVKFV